MCVFKPDARSSAQGLNIDMRVLGWTSFLFLNHRITGGIIFNFFGTDVTDMNVRIMSN